MISPWGHARGAEVCELVGLLMLSKLIENNIEAILYRDDEACLDTRRPRENKKQAE